MILYVNGDSHTASAEATNSYAFAEDDPALYHLGRQPHPDNLSVSWCTQLADRLGYELHCDAESASSNDRIIRTTKQYITKNRPDLVIIQWSTWEREEWIINGEYFQVNASGIDHVPESHQHYYKNYIANIDWQSKTLHAHQRIWQLHNYLLKLNIPHVFFNGNNSFDRITYQVEWGSSYIEPYNSHATFHAQLSKHFNTVNPHSYHYGAEAHKHWAEFLHTYLVDNQLV